MNEFEWKPMRSELKGVFGTAFYFNNNQKGPVHLEICYPSFNTKCQYHSIGFIFNQINIVLLTKMTFTSVKQLIFLIQSNLAFNRSPLEINFQLKFYNRNKFHGCNK